MARALIVGCGCRGRLLGEALAADGWAVRGTSRSPQGLEEIEAAGLEAAPADPEAPASVLELVADVTVVHWLLASAVGAPAVLAALHGPRLQRLLEKLVDTPVRGFVYEGAGSVPAGLLGGGEAIVCSASQRWRIPVAVLDADPADHDAWLTAALAATRRAIA